MARVHYVNKAQASKLERHCRRCGRKIEVGEPYKWAAPRTHRGAQGVKLFFCSLHAPRPSDLTTSDKLATIYSAIEGAEDELDFWDREDYSALQGLLETAAEGIREAAESYRESARGRLPGGNRLVPGLSKP